MYKIIETSKFYSFGITILCFIINKGGRMIKNQSRQPNVSLVLKNLSSGVPTRSDTNHAVQPQKMVIGLKVRTFKRSREIALSM